MEISGELHALVTLLSKQEAMVPIKQIWSGHFWSTEKPLAPTKNQTTIPWSSITYPSHYTHMLSQLQKGKVVTVHVIMA
jgi:hypothetical protein